MIYDPITVVKCGELSFTPVGIMMRNWAFDMGGRPGDPGDYPVELLIAVRDRVTANINSRLLMMEDEQFGDARSQDAFISQIMSTSATFAVPKKLPWWRRLFGA